MEERNFLLFWVTKFKNIVEEITDVILKDLDFFISSFIKVLALYILDRTRVFHMKTCIGNLAILPHLSGW